MNTKSSQITLNQCSNIQIMYDTQTIDRANLLEIREFIDNLLSGEKNKETKKQKIARFKKEYEKFKI